MTHVYTGIHKWVFEGKTASKEETNEIVAPVCPKVFDLLDEYTISVYTVLWNIRADVSTWSELSRFGVARVEHFKEGTGLRIALAEEQKIISQDLRYYRQIGLRVARCQASR